jgi:hypothetical protein
MSRDGERPFFSGKSACGKTGKSKLGAAATTALFLFALAALLIVIAAPVAEAPWSTTNPGINIWVTPNWVDNGKDNVYYMGTTHYVDEIVYGWKEVTYFYVDIKNDNYGNDVNLTLAVNFIYQGPVPNSDWRLNGWLGWAVWDNVNNIWSEAVSGYNSWMQWLRNDDYKNGSMKISDLDNGERARIRLAFGFQNEAVYSAASWFPGNIEVYFTLFNFDNDEVYWTPILDWWVWDYPLENVVNTAVADAKTRLVAPDTNYGSSDNIEVGGSSGNYSYGWLKFPLTMPANWGVQHAYLKYYVTSTTGNFTSRLIRTLENTTWIENDITANNSDAVMSGILGTSSTPFDNTATGWRTMDITDIIRPRVVAGDSLVTINLAGTTTIPNLTIRSKEYGDGSYAPQLILEIAPMTLGEPPTFNIDSVSVSDNNGVGFNLLLRGFVSDMGDDSSATFTFQTNNLQWSVPKIYVYPSAMTSTGYFSMTTTGYEYEADKTYYLRIKGRGTHTQVDVWVPDTEYGYAFTIEGLSPPPPPANPATVTTMPADSILVDKARLRYTLDIGDEESVVVYFRLGDNVDNTDNYSIVDVGSLTASVVNGAKLVEGLTADTTYWFTVRGACASGDVIYGNPLTFETLATPPPPLKPPTLPPISTWGEVIGEKFGIGKEGGGIFCTLLFVMPLLFVVMFLTQGTDNQMFIVLAAGLMLMSAAVAFTWCPIWVPLTVVLILVFAIARGMR